MKKQNLAELTVSSVLGISQKQISTFNNSTKLYDSHNSVYCRDVVTDKDLLIHNTILSYVTSKGINLVSEESKNTKQNYSEYLLLDPLDGSQNYLNGIPAYGTLTSYVIDNQPIASGVCSHTLGVSIFTRLQLNNATEIIFSRKPFKKIPNEYSPLLLAHGPDLKKQTIDNLSNIIFYNDDIFPGFHRLGSIAHAFIQFCLGSYGSFLALKVRPWDLYPILHICSLMEDVEFLLDYGDYLSCYVYYKNLSYPKKLINQISNAFNLKTKTENLIFPFPL